MSYSDLSGFPLPAPPVQTDKNARGRVLVVGGGRWGPGAVQLAALAAYRSGAGKVQVAAASRFAGTLSAALPEAAVITVPSSDDGELAPEAVKVLAPLAARADAIVVGPGVMDEAVGAALTRGLAHEASAAQLLIDAGALTGLDASRPLEGHEGRVAITPHLGEMAALLGWRLEEVEADRLGAARRVAEAMQVVVALKGAETLVVTPNGKAWLHRQGVVGLATSGSGDVLAGLIGGLLAQGASPLNATAWGVCVHAAAGRRLSQTVAETGFLARELLPELPGLLAAG
ncbi:NAD(P)H-hydrate dehydratase [Phenylobacterium sp. LjRoot164]|uniref:NAD(P)H-hydrate dehydratase n=1 Tax=unclassified Phenylobacterium TaxID=2640670 RepID=UPI003ECFDAF2